MTGTSCLSGVHSLENVYILCDFPRVFHGSLPSCTLWEGSIGRATTAPPWEAREGHTGPNPSGAKSPSFPDGKAPGFSALYGLLWPVWTPGGGTDPSPPVPGRFGPHRAQFGRKKRNRPPSRVWGEFRGVILKQDKGSGSLERPQPDHLARQSRSFRAF